MLTVRETVSSSSTGMRPTDNKPKKYDRRHIAIYAAKLAQTVNKPCGALPGEIFLMQNAIKACSPSADLLAMIEAAVYFANASTRLDPRGYRESIFYNIDGRSTRVGLHQREMVHSEGIPEQGEWIYDQQWSMSHACTPSFGCEFNTTIHGANNRSPIIYRHTDFWVAGQVPQSILGAMVGKRFDEIVDREGFHRQFVGLSLDNWIIAKAENKDEMDKNEFILRLKLSQT